MFPTTKSTAAKATAAEPLSKFPHSGAMRSAALGFVSLQIQPLVPHPIQISRHLLSPTTAPQNLSLLFESPTNRRRLLKLQQPEPVLSAKSQQTHLPSPQSDKTQDDGIPVDLVKILVKFKSRHNYIRVLEVSRKADHPFAGARLLLLDGPGNIHSISFLFKSLTNTYFDVFTTLPPILSPGPLGILGFGAGSAARLILDLYPHGAVHGWELDPAVISVAREYFALWRLEKQYPDRLHIYIGNALNAEIKGGFSGLLVDLFSKGCLIPELQDPRTWEGLKRRLRRGGKIMVNVGGSCVEAEDSHRDGRVIMVETLQAMNKVFPGKVHVLSLGNRKDDSSIALVTGELPDDSKTWKRALPKSLRFYADMWTPFDG